MSDPRPEIVFHMRQDVTPDELHAVRLALPLFGFIGVEVEYDGDDLRRIRMRISGDDDLELARLAEWWASAAWRSSARGGLDDA